jgi:hypothetical protein
MVLNMKKVLLLILASLSLPTYAYPLNDVVNTTTQNSISKNSTIASSQIDMAKQWDLTDSEWSQYLKFMQGPSGHYYQQLSPPEVLGIEAETAEDLTHFAEVAAKLEHDKLERELKFNQAFHDAASRLYADEPLIQAFNYLPFTPIP